MHSEIESGEVADPHGTVWQVALLQAFRSVKTSVELERFFRPEMSAATQTSGTSRLLKDLASGPREATSACAKP